jgi:hypothetical protein
LEKAVAIWKELEQDTVKLFKDNGLYYYDHDEKEKDAEIYFSF